MRSIRAIGYDMDYTLIHYVVEAWELRAYEDIKRRLLVEGWPVAGRSFEPELVSRGLIIDTELGNLVKANRFGYVKRAVHGTRPMDFEEQRRVYSRVMIDLADERWVFLNTLFSLSEACMYGQLVDLLDERRLPEVMGYATLWRRVRECLDAAHMEGELKAEIVANPERYVLRDEETALALLDQRHAGKKLMLITNSEWEYTRSMMAYAIDPFLPEGITWRQLFDVIIVGARKPDFFLGRGPLFEVVNEEGLLKPAYTGLREGGIFLGGSAAQIEQHLGLSGDEILYVGDHMWGDVHVS
jgi:5'-nucleotidase